MAGKGKEKDKKAGKKDAKSRIRGEEVDSDAADLVALLANQVVKEDKKKLRSGIRHKKKGKDKKISEWCTSPHSTHMHPLHMPIRPLHTHIHPLHTHTFHTHSSAYSRRTFTHTFTNVTHTQFVERWAVKKTSKSWRNSLKV